MITKSIEFLRFEGIPFYFSRNTLLNMSTFCEIVLVEFDSDQQVLGDIPELPGEKIDLEFDVRFLRFFIQWKTGARFSRGKPGECVFF